MTAPTGPIPDRSLVSGIVLAGGRSSRFGSDKMAVALAGRPLVHHAIEAVAAVCAEVVVVVSVGGDVPFPGAFSVPLRVTRDLAPGGGPLVGLIAGLDAARFPVAIVAGGDMPLLRAAVLEALVGRVGAGGDRVDVAGAGAETEAAADTDAAAETEAAVETEASPAAACLVEDGRPVPLPCALRREPALALARSQLAAGESSLRVLLEALSAAHVPEPEWRALDPDGRTLLDVDRPEDLERARRALS